MISRLLFLALVFGNVRSQTYTGNYYSSIQLNGQVKNDELKKSLQQLIANHTVLTYDDIWKSFLTVDKYLPGASSCSNETIRDIYSSFCWSESEQCGQYKKEGDCYNREHIFPKSWFGGFDAGQGAQTDLFELFPSDGYVNSLRSNYALGEVDTVSYTSTNGCKLGKCASITGFSGECFEIPDVLKGDVARSYFYLSTAYMGVWSCCDTDANEASSIKPWEEAVLKRWHSVDPVDATEMQRQEAIYGLQKNRNPYIDYPILVDYITDF